MNGLRHGQIVDFVDDDGTLRPMLILEVADAERGVVTGRVYEPFNDYTLEEVTYDPTASTPGCWSWPPRA